NSQRRPIPGSSLEPAREGVAPQVRRTDLSEPSRAAPVGSWAVGVGSCHTLQRMKRRPATATLAGLWAIVALTTLATPLAGQQGNQPGTKWTEDQLRQAIELARVGRKLTPKAWPNNAKVAVCLSFDTDTEAPLLRDGTTSPTTLSASDFGAESGIP